MRTLSVLGGLALLVVGAVVPAAAQVSIGADLGLNSRYMFWGQTLSNHPVAQPDIWLSAAGFTGGVWGNVDTGKDKKTSDLTTGGSRSGLTEIDYWLEYNRSVGPVDLKVGTIRWTYNSKNTGTLGPGTGIPNNGPDINSTEIYGAVTLSKVPLSPNLIVYYDVDLYKGLFGWVTISHDVPVATKSVTLAALMAFSTGMSNTTADQIAYFAKQGITYFDFSAAVPLTLGSVSVSPNAHLQVNVDDFTKQTSGTQLNGKTVFTFGVSLAWSRDFGAKEE